MPQAEERWQTAVREKRYNQRKNKKPRLVTEGDSWFDYPPHPNVIDYIDDQELFAIKRFESSGDTLVNIANSIDTVVTTIESEKPQCLLLSAGGNDVVGKGFIGTLFKPFNNAATPREHLEPAIWSKKLSDVEGDFLRVMHKVGGLVPIVIHGYDYMPPSKKGVKFDGFRITGPWVWPAMQKNDITDEQFQRAIVREMINDFNAILVRLQKQFPLHIIHVDLRGMFTPDDWLNEIHLKKSGFKRVAAKFIDTLDNVLPNILQKRAEMGIDS